MSGTMQRVAKAVSVAALLMAADPDLASRARGDIFELAGGGQLQGLWLNEEEGQGQPYEIHTTAGVRLVLDRTQIKQVLRETQLEREYQQELVRHHADAAGHWALAEWCKEHEMKERRQYHLQRVLRLEPDHVAARRGLGYSQVRGNWITQQQHMQEQGYVLYRGRWELPQHVELLETKRRRETGERHWYRQIAQWRSELNRDRAGHASAAILQVKDPLAVRAISVQLTSETVRSVRLLYVQALAHIGTPEALSFLLDVLLVDHDEEVAYACLDRLAEARHPLVHKRCLDILRHESNLLVNRAGTALSRLGEDASIAPLIDALITYHTRIVIGSDGEPTPMVFEFHNDNVLATLQHLTGIAGFGFDKKAWKQWHYVRLKHQDLQEAQGVNLRRS